MRLIGPEFVYITTCPLLPPVEVFLTITVFPVSGSNVLIKTVELSVDVVTAALKDMLVPLTVPNVVNSF